MRIFEQMSRHGQRFELRTEPGTTPHEFAGRLSARLVSLSPGKREAALFASAPEAIDWLTGLYTYCLFSPHEPDTEQHTKAIRTWSRLRFQLLWAVLLLRGEKLISRIRVSKRP